MRYLSTRGTAPAVTAPQAVLTGLAPDGGLYVPERLPHVPVTDLGGLPYPELASRVIGPFVPELGTLLPGLLREAYASFETRAVAPVTVRGRRAYLELFHGPTSAFKDMALQVLPRLLTASRDLLGSSGTSLVLTATSGDTGKAALAGFADVPGTEVVVLYPTDGVSAMQKRQMATQAGHNVHVIGIEGNFDDAQRAVKGLFADAGFRAAAHAAGYALTSANSINLGRLLPQVAYYVHGWHALHAAGVLARDETFDVVVPTGNFGNILAASWARDLGVPIERLVCASNSNKVLADFLTTGTYDATRPLTATTSPSMDILVSSNLERFLHGLDAAAVPAAMASLAATGRFEWGAGLPGWITGGWASEEDMAAALRRTWERDKVLLDPHTAVAAAVADEQPGERVQLVAATASPYKFAPAVLAALGQEMDSPGRPLVAEDLDEDFAAVDRLHELTRVAVPEPLAALRHERVRHRLVVPAADVTRAVTAALAHP